LIGEGCKNAVDVVGGGSKHNYIII
jgi:hypothetical protein